MKTIVIYDSVFGNTEKIARSIGKAIEGEVKVIRKDAVNPSELAAVDLLIIGAPTYGGQPTDPIKNFLKSLPEAAVKDCNVAVFDTRLTTKLVKIFGYAANGIARSLEKMGAHLVLPPEGFLVKGKKGPLVDGELDRASIWAKELAGKISKR